MDTLQERKKAKVACCSDTHTGANTKSSHLVKTLLDSTRFDPAQLESTLNTLSILPRMKLDRQLNLVTRRRCYGLIFSGNLLFDASGKRSLC